MFLHNTAPGVVERLGTRRRDPARRRPAAGRGQHLRLRHERPPQRPQGLRHARPGRVRDDLGHRYAGHPDQDRHSRPPTSPPACTPRCPRSARCSGANAPAQGAVIDVSMFDAAVEWMGHPLYMQLYGGSQIPRMGAEPRGDRPVRRLPHRGRADPDRRAERPRLARAASPTSSPHPSTSTIRASPATSTGSRNRAACDALVAGFTRQWATADLDERLAKAGIPAAQLNTTADVLEHPQLAERDRWRTVSTPAGDIRGVLPPDDLPRRRTADGTGTRPRRAQRRDPRRTRHVRRPHRPTPTTRRSLMPDNAPPVHVQRSSPAPRAASVRPPRCAWPRTGWPSRCSIWTRPPPRRPRTP